MNDLDTEPPPVTPVSPNKRKFSFRFPNTGHHDHDSKTERRNFSDEAQSISDLQVCDDVVVENIVYDKNNNEPEKIYCSIIECKKTLTENDNRDDYVDMTGKKTIYEKNTVYRSFKKTPKRKFSELSTKSFASCEDHIYDNIRETEFKNCKENLSLRKRNDSCPSYFCGSEQENNLEASKRTFKSLYLDDDSDSIWV